MVDSNPFDLKKFKELSREHLLRKHSIKDSPSEELFTMALALSAAVKKVFFERSEQKFSSEPLIVKRQIIEFFHRMRIDGLEKFNDTAFLSVIHFYKDTASRKKEISSGLIIVYIERKFVPEMLRLFKYPYIDYDDDDEVLDGVGAITNLIAGAFKMELARLGYIDLEMSAFTSAINSILNGVEYSKDQKFKHEIVFEFEGKKRLVIEMVMSHLPKVGK